MRGLFKSGIFWSIATMFVVAVVAGLYVRFKPEA